MIGTRELVNDEGLLSGDEALLSGDEALLTGDDPPVFEIRRADARSDFVLTCDHAGLRIPRKLATLNLSEQELATHVACDLGVAELGQRLSARLDAFLILHNYSRLVIDPNRPPGAHDSIVVLSERTRVAANEALTREDVRQRVEELFEPYHRRIADELDRRTTSGRGSVLVTLHTFTPVFLDKPRPWHVGVLYGRDARLARRVLTALRADPALVVGDNQPYAVSDASDYTLVVHGERRGIEHVEIEVRQDLLADEAGVEGWAERLAIVLEEAAMPP
ncbi:MAG TPA: N-formylglutamate amidohydrolase [Candidatus Limnocylindrales bacterium]|nr:N-formylglutamate amidohydrolase [Candidatus Limnocylindrales bacterium]